MAGIQKGVVFVFALFLFLSNASAQRGYHDAPYKRYEADMGMLTNALATPKSYQQSDLQSEASDQVCVDLSNPDASVEWTLEEAADGLVVRYSVPDQEAGELGIYADGLKLETLPLTSKWSWEYLWNDGNPNNNGIVNHNPRMRFDEVKIKLANKIPAGGKLKLVRESGNIHLDFAELEAVPEALEAPTGAMIYQGDGSTLQAFIDVNGGKLIFLPPGTYHVNRELYFGVSNTTFQGAGMWHSQLNFTNLRSQQGGLKANATNINISDLYLTTDQTSRSNSYKGINGVFTSGSSIRNVWAEHFECGAWIGQYNIGAIVFADDFTIAHCRFRNNYADGINLCKGTSNAIVEHCSFRNNGDDNMAIWSANGLECRNNTFRYNTSENGWRAAGCAIYGGYNNKVHHLVIKDNLEAGLRVSNSFPGVGFRDSGMHEFSDITISGCGTFNDLWNNQVGAIDLACSNQAGTRVQNIRFSQIDVVDSRNDAIFIVRRAGEGFYNLVFEQFTIDGTGLEYPYNNAVNLNWGRGYGILFAGSPSGNGTYCNISFANRGGNATANVNTGGMGSFSWIAVTGCTTSTFELPTDPSETGPTVIATGNTITVSGLKIGEVISVYNVSGAKIHSLLSTHETESFHLLKDGVYLVNINGIGVAKKVIIHSSN